MHLPKADEGTAEFFILGVPVLVPGRASPVPSVVRRSFVVKFSRVVRGRICCKILSGSVVHKNTRTELGRAHGPF